VSTMALYQKPKIRELLFSILPKDFKIGYFSGTGAGGQYRNKHQNCVRLHHLDSGTIVTGQSNRNRKANMDEAKKNLVKHPKFKMWHAQKVREIIDGKTLDEKVKEMMIPENLRVEVRKGGNWLSEIPVHTPSAI